MRQQPIQLRLNYYPDGPYQESPCIHCRRMLKHTGAHSGVTWTPVDEPPLVWSESYRRSDWSTCWSNEVSRAAYSGHEPWEAIPLPKVT